MPIGEPATVSCLSQAGTPRSFGGQNFHAWAAVPSGSFQRLALLGSGRTPVGRVARVTPLPRNPGPASGPLNHIPARKSLVEDTVVSVSVPVLGLSKHFLLPTLRDLLSAARMIAEAPFRSESEQGESV